MTKLLMPKATAIWLIENTSLTFKQIADFCSLHELEVQSIADGEVAKGVMRVNPIVLGQLTKEEIGRCEKDPESQLQVSEEITAYLKQDKKVKTGRYVPVIRRQDKPDAISWVIKHCPEMTDAQIAKLLGSTKGTVQSIRDKTHWNSSNIKPKDPVLLGLCSQTDLDNIYKAAIEKAEKSKTSGKG